MALLRLCSKQLLLLLVGLQSSSFILAQPFRDCDSWNGAVNQYLSATDCNGLCRSTDFIGVELGNLGQSGRTAGCNLLCQQDSTQDVCILAGSLCPCDIVPSTEQDFTFKGNKFVCAEFNALKLRADNP